MKSVICTLSVKFVGSEKVLIDILKNLNAIFIHILNIIWESLYYSLLSLFSSALYCFLCCHNFMHVWRCAEKLSAQLAFQNQYSNVQISYNWIWEVEQAKRFSVHFHVCLCLSVCVHSVYINLHCIFVVCLYCYHFCIVPICLLSLFMYYMLCSLFQWLMSSCAYVCVCVYIYMHIYVCICQIC